jgi:hypothetical protein
MSPGALRVVAPLGGLTAGVAAAFAWSACTNGHDFGGSLALSVAGGACAMLLGAGVGAATSAWGRDVAHAHARTALACGAIALAFYVALLRWPSTWVALGALGAGPWTALPLAVLPLVGAIAGACSAALGERRRSSP